MQPHHAEDNESVPEVQLFWEQANELFVVLDAEGRFLSVNPAWTRVLGWTEDQLIARYAVDFVAAGDRCATEAAEPLPDGSGKVIRDVDNRYRHADGSVRWLRWNGYERGGRWFGTARDVTASRTMDLALRISERRARSILEAMNDGLIVIDSDGRVAEVNDVFARIAGRPVSELVSKSAPFPWWPPGEAAHRRKLLRQNLENPGGTWETTIQRPDGHLVPVLVSVSGLTDDRTGERSMLLAYRDISELTALRDRLADPHRMDRLPTWK